MSKNINNTSASEKKLSGKAILVGVDTGTATSGEYDYSSYDIEKSLDELERLLATAGGTVFARMTQSKEAPDPRTYIGSGKVTELADLCADNEIELVVFDTELSPSQIRNLEDRLGNVTVIDRSMLILDIFALHAVTGEGKLQVELAQLKYTVPRLSGKGTELSRLGGGIGTRGPGESKLESDRRHIKRRIAALEAELETLEKNRKTMRASRDKSNMPGIAIVGYTNAGKSTLLNYFTNAGILVEDKLFATLDPTTRKLELPCGEDVLLTDTVGFISRLPHHLVKAFKSTLDEAVYADILMIVIDASDPEYRRQISVTEKILSELGADGKPTVYVFNKCDRSADELPVLPTGNEGGKKDAVYISAITGEGTDKLLEKLEEIIHDGKKLTVFRFPGPKAGLVNTLYQNATVNNVDYGDEYITVTAVTDERVRGMLSEYVVEVL